MTTTAPKIAILIGAASIGAVCLSRPDIGLGLSLLALAAMILHSLPRGSRPPEDEYQPPRRQPRPTARCRCGRCEQCDPLAQTWGG